MTLTFKTSCNKIFVLLGNARTFLECFETFCSRMLLNLFDNNTKENTFLLLYLKTDDPGSKKQNLPNPKMNFNFDYSPVNTDEINLLIDKMEKQYTNVQFVRFILPTNQKTDEELFQLIPKRELYYDWLNCDVQLKRALQQAYNYQACDKLIGEIERDNNIEFDFYIAVRPDLYFLKEYNDISTYYKAVERPMNKVLGSHDMYFFIPKEQRQGLRVIDYVTKNTTVKMRVTEQLQWGAQGQPIWGPSPGVGPNNDLPLDYYLIKRPDHFYLPIGGFKCEPPDELKELNDK